MVRLGRLADKNLAGTREMLKIFINVYVSIYLYQLTKPCLYMHAMICITNMALWRLICFYPEHYMGLRIIDSVDLRVLKSNV